MSTTIPSQYAPLLQVEDVIVYPIVTVMVMCIVYGFYIALFALCIHLLRQGEVRYRAFYTSSITSLFVISTITVAVEATDVLYTSITNFASAKSQDFLPDTLKQVLEALIFILSVVANAFADVVLIHRCYVIWGSSKPILVPLAFTSFAVNVTLSTGTTMIIIGLSDIRVRSNVFDNGQYILGIGLILSAAFNSVLTLLTAGRIWWITRCVKGSKTYVVTTMNKIILESGILYPLTMALHLSILNGPSSNEVPLDTFPLTVLAAGIAPTLVIVRIRLGISAPDGEVTQPPRSSIFLDSIQPTERSQYLSRISRISAVGRRLSMLEGIQVKPLPKVHPKARSV